MNQGRTITNATNAITHPTRQANGVFSSDKCAASIVGKSVFGSGNRFFEAQLSEFWGSTFRISRLNFPNSKAQLSEFSGWTFRIFRISLPNFPNFPSENQWGPFFFFFFLGLTLRTFRICLNFLNFPDELSEFCSTFRIFSEFSGWAFQIFRMNFPNFAEIS